MFVLWTGAIVISIVVGFKRFIKPSPANITVFVLNNLTIPTLSLLLAAAVLSDSDDLLFGAIASFLIYTGVTLGSNLLFFFTVHHIQSRPEQDPKTPEEPENQPSPSIETLEEELEEETFVLSNDEPRIAALARSRKSPEKSAAVGTIGFIFSVINGALLTGWLLSMAVSPPELDFPPTGSEGDVIRTLMMIPITLFGIAALILCCVGYTRSKLAKRGLVLLSGELGVVLVVQFVVEVLRV